MSACCTAALAPMNPMRLWVPSQNGLMTDPPQRHKATRGNPSGVVFLFASGISIGFPSASTSLKSPMIQYGPLFRHNTVTSDIFQSG